MDKKVEENCDKEVEDGEDIFALQIFYLNGSLLCMVI